MGGYSSACPIDRSVQTGEEFTMPRYITLGMLKLKPGSRAAAEQIADQGAPGVAQQAGFERVVFFLDEERNEYGAVTFWESRETAEQANAILTPQFQQAFGDRMEGDLDSRVYEIYEHKA
jgi:heme-degrading monooxygenase HmoA